MRIVPKSQISKQQVESKTEKTRTSSRPDVSPEMLNSGLVEATAYRKLKDTLDTLEKSEQSLRDGIKQIEEKELPACDTELKRISRAHDAQSFEDNTTYVKTEADLRQKLKTMRGELKKVSTQLPAARAALETSANELREAYTAMMKEPVTLKRSTKQQMREIVGDYFDGSTKPRIADERVKNDLQKRGLYDNLAMLTTAQTALKRLQEHKIEAERQLNQMRKQRRGSIPSPADAQGQAMLARNLEDFKDLLKKGTPLINTMEKDFVAMCEGEMPVASFKDKYSNELQPLVKALNVLDPQAATTAQKIPLAVLKGVITMLAAFAAANLSQQVRSAPPDPAFEYGVAGGVGASTLVAELADHPDRANALLAGVALWLISAYVLVHYQAMQGE
jgi:hypothetical protein